MPKIPNTDKTSSIQNRTDKSKLSYSNKTSSINKITNTGINVENMSSNGEVLDNNKGSNINKNYDKRILVSSINNVSSNSEIFSSNKSSSKNTLVSNINNISNTNKTSNGNINTNANKSKYHINKNIQTITKRADFLYLKKHGKKIRSALLHIVYAKLQDNNYLKNNNYKVIANNFENINKEINKNNDKIKDNNIIEQNSNQINKKYCNNEIKPTSSKHTGRQTCSDCEASQMNPGYAVSQIYSENNVSQTGSERIAVQTNSGCVAAQTDWDYEAILNISNIDHIKYKYNYNTKVAYIASKKVVGKAFKRNKVKRRLRSLVREYFSIIPNNYLILFIASSKTYNIDYSLLKNDFLYCISKINN